MIIVSIILFAYSGITFDADAVDPGATQSVIENGGGVQCFSRVAPQPMPGWPKNVGTHPNYKPSGIALVDINNDGYLEIILGSTDQYLYAWDYQGNPLPGWPISMPAPIQAKVAVGDIDNNGDQEIVCAARNGYVYVYNHDATPFGGWPQNADGVIGFVAPTLFDLDRDGDLEVIMVQMQSGQPGHVYIWHHNGQTYSGWPKNTDYLGVATASVADMDNDSLFEICALSYRSVYVWDQNGNPETGWPKLNVAGGMSYAQAVLADLDADQDLELLHAYYTGAQNYVGIYHHAGTVFANWPQTFPGPQTYTTPVTGDLDGDTDLEIFNGGHIMGGVDLLARHHDGTAMPGWPVACDLLECSPLVLDIEDDGGREAVVGDNLNPGSLWSYEVSGSVTQDWPAATSAAAIVNSPAVGDVDCDGDVEIALLVSDGTVHLWTLDSVQYRPYRNEWGTFFHDDWNTGWFHPRPPAALSAQASADHIDLAWRRNTEPDIAGYRVYRGTASTGPYTLITPVLVMDTAYADTSAGSGITYYYCVTARIKAQTESRLSNEAMSMIGIKEAGSGPGDMFTVTPNPFRDFVQFGPDMASLAMIRVYDIRGRLVSVFADREWRPGRDIPDGIYIVELNDGTLSRRLKVIRVR